MALSVHNLDYGNELEQAIGTLASIWNEETVSSRALAIRALENDALILNSLTEEDRAKVRQTILSVEIDIDLQVADTKYSFIHNELKHIRKSEGKLSRSFTEKADLFILNKWVGVPFFFVVMYLMFMFSINIGSAFIDFF